MNELKGCRQKKRRHGQSAILHTAGVALFIIFGHTHSTSSFIAAAVFLLLAIHSLKQRNIVARRIHEIENARAETTSLPLTRERPSLEQILLPGVKISGNSLRYVSFKDILGYCHKTRGNSHS